MGTSLHQHVMSCSCLYRLAYLFQSAPAQYNIIIQPIWLFFSAWYTEKAHLWQTSLIALFVLFETASCEQGCGSGRWKRSYFNGSGSCLQMYRFHFPACEAFQNIQKKQLDIVVTMAILFDK